MPRRKIIKKKEEKNKIDYKNGGEGFRYWCEDKVRLAVYHDDNPVPQWTPIYDLPRTPNKLTGRTYWDMWENFCEIAEQALKMEDGRFLHRLIVFCWMRGEGKSLDACLIQLWKFFCFARQQIMLGANSKEQTKFVHYDIMRDIILNSPELLKMVGKKNVQEKEIRLRDAKKNVTSVIRSISSFSGIVSNITGYTFSEIFDMKNPKFFVQLDGSIRNMPNAMGVIDSTVSENNHILKKLYDTYRRGEDPSLFFSYRCSKNGDNVDFWNPQMTQMQLNSYRAKFPSAEFGRYFRNVWSAGSEKLFTAAMVRGTHYIGRKGMLGDGIGIITDIEKMVGIEERLEENDYRTEKSRQNVEYELESLSSSLIHIENIYNLKTDSGHPRMATMSELNALGDQFQTDWVILAGVDRADPMKAQSTRARTMATLVAKGLPNSRNNPEVFLKEGGVDKFIYLNLGTFHVEDSSIEEIKRILGEGSDTFDGVDILCSERWGMWDIATWCEEMGMGFEATSPTYDRQREAFSELFILYKNGRFFSPAVMVKGSKEDDILVEEAKMLDHNPSKKWYGSPEKGEKYGVQDDAIFSVAWAIYGGRNLGVEDFRSREQAVLFGEFKAGETIGKY